ncbi:hypothetical protein LTR56_010165 [Elasticomyces elasticus]|nr:hypothetical protein LTR22_021110 [Elasticomyces elasticus]KAK3643427.1 hypothetical protein LTR56_010165 [Elasticomyces elasticus]KAK5761264.1 hypothetical protein LTS12_008540 [Elasticomyces elasticus]
MASIPDLATCKKIGFIVPSSNTAVEPITNAIFQSLPNGTNIIPLFTRIGVKTVGTDASSTSQFSTDTMVAAAQLLADAECSAILWNGTSGMWVGTGLEADRQLAKAMSDATGIPCSTTTLATVEALSKLGKPKLSIAVPYDEPLALKVREFYAEIADYDFHEPTPASNLEIAKTSLQDVEEVIMRAAKMQHVQVVVPACTNWPAALITESVEAGTSAIVVDSIVVTVWQGLRMAGCDAVLPGWGKMSTLI